MLHKDSGSRTLDKAVDIIQTISELRTAFSKAEQVALASGDPLIVQDITNDSYDSMLALGLALHRELSKIYEEEKQ